MKKIKNLIGGLAIASLLFYSCAAPQRAQWHLGRAVALDPSVVETRIDTVNIPEIRLDTFVDIRYDSLYISEGIDSILISIPDCKNCTQATREIVKFITNTPQIQDTLYFSKVLENDSVRLNLAMKVWQDGTYVKMSVVLEDSVIKIEDKTVFFSPKHNRWSLILGIGIILILISIFYKIITKLT
jgi:hypothetical protein